jgi:hypothetical protein
LTVSTIIDSRRLQGFADRDSLGMSSCLPDQDPDLPKCRGFLCKQAGAFYAEAWAWGLRGCRNLGQPLSKILSHRSELLCCMDSSGQHCITKVVAAFFLYFIAFSPSHDLQLCMQHFSLICVLYNKNQI